MFALNNEQFCICFHLSTLLLLRNIIPVQYLLLRADVRNSCDFSLRYICKVYTAEHKLLKLTFHLFLV
jgi:hypothetical protein